MFLSSSDFKFNIIVHYKYGNVFRDVLHSPKFNWCHVMKSKTSNILLTQMIEVFHENFPEFIHECPYSVSRFFYQTKNKVQTLQDLITFNTTMEMGRVLSYFATGDYKVKIFINTHKNQWIADMWCIMTITTDHKEVYG